MTTRYNRNSVMSEAWRLQRKAGSTFQQALQWAWANEKARHAAKEAAGIEEETHTWYGWKELGFEVRHESKAIFQATFTDPATKSGTRKMSYFGRSQVQAIQA